MAEPSPRYTIYLLTVWHDSPHNSGNASDPSNWRFRLENPRTKEGRGCVGVEALIARLLSMIRHDCADTDQPPAEDNGKTEENLSR